MEEYTVKQREVIEKLILSFEDFDFMHQMIINEIRSYGSYGLRTMIDLVEQELVDGEVEL